MKILNKKVYPKKEEVVRLEKTKTAEKEKRARKKTQRFKRALTTLIQDQYLKKQTNLKIPFTTIQVWKTQNQENNQSNQRDWQMKD